MEPVEILNGTGGNHNDGGILKARWRVIILGMVTILMVLSVVVFLLTIRMFNHNIESVEASYAQKTFPAENTRLCPGDTLVVPFVVNVEHAPSVFHIIEGIWSVDQHRMQEMGKNNQIFLYRETGRFSLTARYDLPNTIQPGLYEYRRAAEQRFSGSIMFYTPFEVKSSGDCPTPVPGLP